MNRLIAILLVPFFVVGNSLAHSHGDATHRSGNGARAHIHIGGAAHDDHRHHGPHGHSQHHHAPEHDGGGPESMLVDPTEHDADAIYLAAGDALFTASERCSLELETLVEPGTETVFLGVSCRSPGVLTLRAGDPAGLPLYLLQAALRL